MLASVRFWLYRNIIALFMFLSFRSQKIVPLEAPVDGPVQFQPYADAQRGMPVKGLWMATTFPAGRSRGEATPADQDPDQASGVGQAHRATTHASGVEQRAALCCCDLSHLLPEGVADRAQAPARTGRHRRPARGVGGSWAVRVVSPSRRRWCLRRRRRLDHRVRRRPGLGPPGRHGRVHRARRPPRHREASGSWASRPSTPAPRTSPRSTRT